MRDSHSKERGIVRSDAYTRAAGPRPATATIPGTVRNHTGGAVFEIGDAARARRFLVIGSAGGTYYQAERDITSQNVDVIARMAESDPAALIAMIADVSTRGIAPKVDPQLFALAVMTSGDGDARTLAFTEFGAVVRTGSHLLMWARYHKALGGKFGRGVWPHIRDWYLRRDADSLAYQLAKYRQRDGWSQKDLIDMSHSLMPVYRGRASTEAQRAALRWARGEALAGSTPPHGSDGEIAPHLLYALSLGATVQELVQAGASWEMLPDTALRKAETWELLLAERKLPLTAMIRQLARMTELGVFDTFGVNAATQRVLEVLGDEGALRGARIHPINVLLAHRQYRKGESRSGLRYTPNAKILDALDDAFYASFQTAPAANKRTLVGVDISSSMTYNSSIVGLTSHEIATVLAMKILRTEPASHVVGFSHVIHNLGMTPKMTLTEALRTTQGAFGATDPSALIAYASGHKIEVDTFVVITDNEVNRGYHVPDTLRAYRKASGIDAKLAVLGTTATNFSIADPNDLGMLDIAGFGSDVPALLTEFSRGL